MTKRGATTTLAMRAATDEEATLWHCEACCASGVLLIDTAADVGAAVRALHRVHALASPQCKPAVPPLRVARPNGWFQQITDLAEEILKATLQKNAGTG